MALTDLDVLLADLKRQRQDLDQRIRDIETQRGGTTEIIDRLQKWRERAERTQQIGSDDETLRMRR